MMNLDDEYSQGILLHLFLDYYWDTKVVGKYISSYRGSNWFRDYRQEISLTGAWLYHHVTWSRAVWAEMLTCPDSAYANAPELAREDVVLLINTSFIWHQENNIGPSSVFTPDFVEEFTDIVATEYEKWLTTLN
jgi:hypothetical protein